MQGNRVTDQEMTKLQGLIAKSRRWHTISVICAILFTTVAVYFFFSQETSHAKMFGFVALTQCISIGLNTRTLSYLKKWHPPKK